MSRLLLPAWEAVRTPLIGMLHLPPLPGAPRARESLPAIREYVLHDADALVAGGVHGLLLENFGDAPFYPGPVPPAVVAQMTELAGDVRRCFDLPLGINVLRNDARAALAVAASVGADFIRVNVLCGARLTDQGIISGEAHLLLRDRAALRASHIRILADVGVKHSSALGLPRPLDDEIHETLARGGADAVIISGAGTGQPADVDQVRRARAASGDAPVLVGSGVTADNVEAFAPYADGLIVGTALKADGVTTRPVDRARVRAIVQALR